MKKTAPKKMTLTRETIGTLSDSDTQQVFGGVTGQLQFRKHNREFTEPIFGILQRVPFVVAEAKDYDWVRSDMLSQLL